MTKNAIIEKLFLSKNFNDCLCKMEPEHLRDDLRSEVILIICELPEAKLIGMHDRKELEFFTVRVILNLIKSNTSPFAKKFRNNHTDIEAILHKHDEVMCLEERQLREMVEDIAFEEIDKLYWYNKGLVELYMKHGNFRSVGEETGIPYVSCYKTIQKSFVTIKERTHEKKHLRR